MSFTIDNQTVVGFSSAVHVLAEQQGSKLRRLVTQEAAPNGEAYAREIIENTFTARSVTDAFAPTNPEDGMHSRRWVFLKIQDAAARFDPRTVNPRILTDPRSRYVEFLVNALAKATDDEILDAFDRPVATGRYHTAGSTSAFPAANIIASANTGLTDAKLITALELINTSEVGDFTPRYCLISPEELSDLLNNTKVQSADYNVVKALVSGQVNTWLGFEFVRSNRLVVNASGERKCYALTPEATVLGTWKGVETNIGVDVTKSFSWLAQVSHALGAARLDDQQIYQILCK